MDWNFFHHLLLNQLASIRKLNRAGNLWHSPCDRVVSVAKRDISPLRFYPSRRSSSGTNLRNRTGPPKRVCKNASFSSWPGAEGTGRDRISPSFSHSAPWRSSSFTRAAISRYRFSHAEQFLQTDSLICNTSR